MDDSSMFIDVLLWAVYLLLAVAVGVALWSAVHGVRTHTRSVDALAEALGRYRFHCGCYPTAEDGGLDALAAKTSRYPGWLGPYAGSWGTIIPDPWKRPYIYEPQTNGPPVVLSLGADGVRGTADDVMPDPALFEKPFTDPSWTNDWVHFSKRGIILVPKKQVEK